MSTRSIRGFLSRWRATPSNSDDIIRRLDVVVDDALRYYPDDPDAQAALIREAVAQMNL